MALHAVSLCPLWRNLHSLFRRRFGGWFASRLLLASLLLAPAALAQVPQQRVYSSKATTTTNSVVNGFDKDGASGFLASIAGSPFPAKLEGGFLAIDGQGKFLFMLNPASNNISMFQIDQSTGALAEVPASPFATTGTTLQNPPPSHPTSLATEKSGNYLYVGYQLGNTFGNGAVAMFLIDSANQRLVPLPNPNIDVPASPIQMFSDPKGLRLYVALGLDPATGQPDDEILVYDIDPLSGNLFSSAIAGGNSLLRSTAIDPQGRFLFFCYGQVQGALQSAQISPLNGGSAGGGANPDGSPIDLGQGQFAFGLLVDGSGKFLYAGKGSQTGLYSIDPSSGALTVLQTPLSAISFQSGEAVADPAGPFIYMTAGDGLHAYSVDSQTGALSDVPGSPVSPGGNMSVAISGTAVQAAKGPIAALFPASFGAFGDVTVGQPPLSHIISVVNTGDQLLSITAISTTNATTTAFSQTNNCVVPLNPNADCSITVSFAPTAPGQQTATLQVTDNAPGSPQSVALSGNGISTQPAMTLSPASLVFTAITQGTVSAPQSVNVTNSGNAPLSISSVALGGSNPGDFTLVNNCTVPVAVSASCTIDVKFAPLAGGQRTSSISISSNASTNPQSVALSGTGIPAQPAITLSPASLVFAAITQGAISAPQSVNIANSGTASLSVTSITLGGSNPGDFTLTNNCTSPVAVGASCAIDVKFAPVAVGQRTATISIANNASANPQTVSLSGSANSAFTVGVAASGTASASVSAGQTAQYNLQLTPAPDFAGPVNFSCTGAPAAATCVVAPQSVQVANASPIPFSVTVTTAGKAVVVPFSVPRNIPLNLWLVPLVGLFLFVVFQKALRRVPVTARCALASAAIALALLAATALSGCGGASANSAQATTPAPAPPAVTTPSGTFTLTVTATSGQLQSQTILLTLTVK